MLCRFTLASGAKSIKKLLGSTPVLPYPYYLSEGRNYPVMRRLNGQMQWTFMDVSPSNPLIRMQEVFTNTNLRKCFHHHPVIIPSNCIFAEVSGKVKLIRSLTSRVFLFAGIIDTVRNRECFKVLTCESPDIVSEYTDRIPVLIDAEEHMKYLMDPDLEFVSNIADLTGSDWFDVFDVSPQVATSTVNAKNLIRPLHTQDRSKVDNLNKEILEFRNRANRRSGK